MQVWAIVGKTSDTNKINIWWKKFLSLPNRTSLVANYNFAFTTINNISNYIADLYSVINQCISVAVMIMPSI